MKDLAEEIKEKIFKLKKENEDLRKLLSLLKIELLDIKSFLVNKDSNV